MRSISCGASRERVGRVHQEPRREVAAPDLQGLHQRLHGAPQVWHIGPRVVLTWQVEQAWHPGRFRLRIGNDHQRLVAFENVFCVLDGAPKYDSSSSELGHAIAAAPNGIGETRWFKFRCFKNGNLHLEFRRPDLVARINQIAGSRAMRPAS